MEALTKSVIVVTMVSSCAWTAARVFQTAKVCLIAMFFVVFDFEGSFPSVGPLRVANSGRTRLLGNVDLHALATVIIANWGFIQDPCTYSRL